MSTIVYRGIDYSALRRGAEEFELETGETLLWPRCGITECPNMVCMGMSRSLCYPHGIEFGAFTETEFKRNRGERS